jgi:hypothetical protein
MQDQLARSLISASNLANVKANIFRFKQSLDDPNLLFWRPLDIQGGEWPFIFFLTLEDGKLLPNKDFGASV